MKRASIVKLSGCFGLNKITGTGSNNDIFPVGDQLKDPVTSRNGHSLNIGIVAINVSLSVKSSHWPSKSLPQNTADLVMFGVPSINWGVNNIQPTATCSVSAK